jgi:hypothetical protein
MRQIELRSGGFTIVDDDDFDRLSRTTWTKDTRGYVVHWIRKKVIRIHREVLCLATDDPRLVDHINGDRLDNRRSNLRICTSHQNSLNRASSGRSGYKGVTWHKKANKWQAAIMLHGKTTYLGLFSTPESAYEAYKQAAIDLHGEFASFGR